MEQVFKYRGQDCFSRNGLSLTITNQDRTVLIALHRRDLESMLDAGEQGPSRSEWVERVGNTENDSFVFAAVSQTGLEYVSRYTKHLDGLILESMGQFSSIAFPLFDHSKHAIGRVSFNQDILSMKFVVESKDEDSLNDIKETAIALKVLYKSVLASEKQQYIDNYGMIPAGIWPMTVDMIEQVLDNATFETATNNQLIITTDAQIDRSKIADVVALQINEVKNRSLSTKSKK